ncbi:metal-dependent hydrolase [Natronocalculus amylovorans]|uniref:Metal-dependent hydrolase n=1 Tax=Natronocalculus amylovorans TaxID=2917812 RepID=A0AAE3KDE4_9EURY|nr:metal-dependent hydrolase [Natronocalculus amylovorans]MCL9818279.1 metal-dependent hydrolase [Natronocalculus amylovorans]
MMPWEHAVIGYIGYSLFIHAFYRDSPTASETIVVVFASILPDLIDKPLAWEFGIFASGYAIGHSIFFAVPLSLAVGLLAYRRGSPRLGWAFGIGYLLHTPFDIIPSYVRDGEVPIDRALWPLHRSGSGEGGEFRGEFIGNMVPYAQWALEEATSGEPSPYFLFLLGLFGFTFLLWLYDGAPVAREAVQIATNRESHADDDRSR